MDVPLLPGLPSKTAEVGLPTKLAPAQLAPAHSARLAGRAWQLEQALARLLFSRLAAPLAQLRW